MASPRYTYACTLSWGDDTPTAEVEVEVSFSVAWGSPERGRWGPPEHYDPGAPSEVEDIRLEKVEGKPRPWGMYSGYVANEDDAFATECVEKLEGSPRHLADMLSAAADAEEARAPDPGDARDQRNDDRLAGLV